MARNIVREACDEARGAEVWAVVMQEGLANLAVLTGSRTVLRQRVEVAVPRKRGVGRQGEHDKVCPWCGFGLSRKGSAGEYR